MQNNKSTIKAWAMFDWSNSAYNLVITSTIFPAYYTIITTTEQNGDKVMFLEENLQIQLFQIMHYQ